jgi:hypothetical protein
MRGQPADPSAAAGVKAESFAAGDVVGVDGKVRQWREQTAPRTRGAAEAMRPAEPIATALTNSLCESRM